MMYYILIAVFLLLYSYLTCKNTKTGIYLIVLFLPSYLIRFKIGPIPFTLLEGMILILFFCWLFKIFQSGGKLNFNIFRPSINNPIPKIFRLPIILFLAATTISVFISNNQTAALGIWKAYFIEPLIFFIVLIYNIKDIKQIKNIIYCLGILTIVIGIFAFIQKLTGVLISNPFWFAAATRRVTTFFGYPNANGLLLAPIIILTIGNLLTDKKLRLIIFNLLIFSLGSLTLYWAKSTGAIIAVSASLIFLLIYYKKTRFVTSLVTIILLILILALPASPYNLKNLQTQLVSHKLGLNATSLEIRINQWQETWQMLKDNPLFGAGLANYQNKVKPYHQYKFLEIFLYPHNLILNFWSEIGLLGLIAFVWLIFVFYRVWVLGLRFLHNQRSKLVPTREAKEGIQDQTNNNVYGILTLVTGTAMLTILIHGLVDVPYFKNDLSILFWVIIELLIIITNNLNLKEPNNNQKLKTKNPCFDIR